MITTINNIFAYILSTNTIYGDIAENWQLSFQDSGSPNFTALVSLHDSVGFYLILILVSVFFVLSSLLYFYSENKNKIAYKYLTHGTALELIWTITPALILIILSFPSLRLLYMMDEVITPSLTIKILGHQWYWSYEYSDFVTDNGESIEFDSYMIPESDLELGQFRLLDVDENLIIPANCHIRLILASTDVIHSYAVPALGLKLDAVPGRLNQTSFMSEREGEYFGQCSELCGPFHGFMPTKIKAVSSDDFIVWLSELAMGVNLVRIKLKN